MRESQRRYISFHECDANERKWLDELDIGIYLCEEIENLCKPS